MTQKTIEFQVITRSTLGKVSAKALRKLGSIPATISYMDGTSISVAVPDQKNIQALERAGGLMSSLASVSIDGGEPKTLLIKSRQLNSVTLAVEHIEFQALDASEIKMQLILFFKNSALSPGIKKGGVLHIVKRTIPVIVKVENIVSSLTLDIASLDSGDSIYYQDIQFPEGMRPAALDKNNPLGSKNLIAKLMGKRGKAAAEEGEEGESDAEGESAEAAPAA